MPLFNSGEYRMAFINETTKHCARVKIKVVQSSQYSIFRRVSVIPFLTSPFDSPCRGTGKSSASSIGRSISGPFSKVSDILSIILGIRNEVAAVVDTFLLDGRVIFLP